MAYFAYGMAWLSTGIATGIAVCVTKSAVPLWALLIPAMISVKRSDDKSNE